MNLKTYMRPLTMELFDLLCFSSIYCNYPKSLAYMEVHVYLLVHILNFRTIFVEKT